jgi:hypothetical protein
LEPTNTNAPTPAEPAVPADQLAHLIEEWLQTGVTLIDALGSPLPVVRAFTQLQLRMMGK